MVPGVLERRLAPRNARNFPAPLQELFGERGPDAGSRSRYKGQPSCCRRNRQSIPLAGRSPHDVPRLRDRVPRRPKRPRAAARPSVRKRGRKTQPSSDTAVQLGDPQRPRPRLVCFEPGAPAVNADRLGVRGDKARCNGGVINLDDRAQIFAFREPVAKGMLQTMSRCSIPLLRSLPFASLPCSLMASRTSLVESAKRSASS